MTSDLCSPSGTYSGLPGPCAAGFNGDGAGPVSGRGMCFVGPGDQGRSFKGRGWFGGSLSLFHEEEKMNKKNKSSNENEHKTEE